MIDKLLITQDDIKIYRPTAELDEARISPFILEAQNIDLNPVLNNALFLDFLDKFDDTEGSDYSKYNELLFGKRWTYNGNTEYFRGVRPMLAYFALSRFVINNPLNVTRFGIVKKVVSQSEVATPQEIKMLVSNLDSCAITYQNDVMRFLCNNTTTYPLYNSGGASEAAARTTSFNFFKG
jgi:hypothetical protein